MLRIFKAFSESKNATNGLEKLLSLSDSHIGVPPKFQKFFQVFPSHLHGGVLSSKMHKILSIFWYYKCDLFPIIWGSSRFRFELIFQLNLNKWKK